MINSQIGYSGTYFNIIKTLYDKPAANTLSDEKLKAFSLRNKTKVPTHTTPIQHSPLFNTILKTALLARAIK